MLKKVMTVAVMVTAFVACEPVLFAVPIVTAVGADTNEPGFRSTSVVKSLDADGDNIYGTLGNSFWGTSIGLNVGTMPAWATIGTEITPSTPGTLIIYGNGANSVPGPYATGDNPNLTGATVADIGLGIIGKGGRTPASAVNLFEVQITSLTGAPTNGIRFGIAVAGTAEPPSSLVLVSFNPGADGNLGGVGANADSVDSFATLPVVVTDYVDPDFYFFDVDELYVGQWLVIQGAANAFGSAFISGITIDAIPIPEPNSLSLLAFGMVAMFLFRKRRG